MSLSSLWAAAPVAVPSHHACNLCGTRDVFVVGTRDRDRRPLRTVICRACGLVWTDPRPSDAAIAAYYAREYRQHYKGAHQPKPRHLHRAGAVAQTRFNQLRDVLAGCHDVLDVGASSGEFVHVLRAAGKAAIGIEPHEGYSAWAREALRLPVITIDWTEAQFAANRFDAITLFHVLEHLADPLGAVRQFARWLRPGGRLVIEVPNVEATCGSPRHRFHFAHLHGFNLPTLGAVGRAAGLAVEREYTSPDSGVIRVVLRRVPGAETPVAGLPGNCRRVLDTFARHGLLAHYLSPRTWVRPIYRLQRRWRETVVAQRHRTPLALLEAARAAADD